MPAVWQTLARGTVAINLPSTDWLSPVQAPEVGHPGSLGIFLQTESVAPLSNEADVVSPAANMACKICIKGINFDRDSIILNVEFRI